MQRNRQVFKARHQRRGGKRQASGALPNDLTDDP
jgi:hypothetical protein